MLTKTPLGETELQPGRRTLGLRERAVLVLADGTRSREMLASLYDGTAAPLVDRLLELGFIAPSSATAREAPRESEQATHVVDSFKVVRPSLGEARLYLFDLSERLLAPRDKHLAEHFREKLRLARDEAALIAVANKLLDMIAEHATPERVSGMAEKLQRFFPDAMMRPTQFSKAVT